MSIPEKAIELWSEVANQLEDLQSFQRLAFDRIGITEGKVGDLKVAIDSIRRDMSEKLETLGESNKAIIANLSDLLETVEKLEAAPEAGGSPESLESQIKALGYPSGRIIVLDDLQVIQDDRQTTPVPGTVYVIKEGTYGSLKLTRTGSQAEFSGEPGKPLVILAEPGKTVTLKAVDKALSISGSHDVIIDGLTLISENSGRGSGLHLDGKYQGPIRDLYIKNLSSSGWMWGCNGTGGDIWNSTFLNCDFSNNPGEHGVYMGARAGYMQRGVIFNECTFNGNAKQGLYVNCFAENFLIELCEFIGNDDAITLFNGVSDTTINDCDITTDDKGIIFYAYFQGVKMGIVPHDSTGNLVQNCRITSGGPSVYFNVQEAGDGFPIKMVAEIRDCTYNNPPVISDSKWLTADVTIT